MENSKSELLNWINQLVKMNHSKIEQLGNGIAYCKLLHIFDPHSLPSQKINQKVKVQLDNISNLKLLQSAMSKLHFKKSIDIDKLSKLVFHENYELLLFLKQQYTLKFQNVDQENLKENLQIQNTSKINAEEHLLVQFKEEIKSILTSKDLTPKEIINQLKYKLDIQSDFENEEQIDDQKQLFRTDSKRKIELQEIHQKNIMLCETPNSVEGNLSYQKNNEILEFNVNPNNSSKNNQDNLIQIQSSSKKILDISNQSQQQQQQQQLLSQYQQQSIQSTGTPQFSQVKQKVLNQSTENILLSGKQSPNIFNSYREAQQIQIQSQNKEMENFYSAQKQICLIFQYIQGYNSGIKQYANSVQRLPQSQQRYGFNNMESIYNEKLKSDGCQQSIQEEIQLQLYTPICSNGGGLQEE